MKRSLKCALALSFGVAFLGGTVIAQEEASELDTTVVEGQQTTTPAPPPQPVVQPAPVIQPDPEPIIIDDDIDVPYISTEPVSAGRSEIPMLESAQSSTVFTADFIEDLSIVNIEDVVTRSAGVTLQHSGEGRDKNFSIRGFDARILRNGFSLAQFGANANLEPYGLERIEVLKGSNSIAYGDTTPGGFINIVSKRPLGYNHGEIGVEFGSFNAVSPRFDVGGRIGGAPAGGGKVVLDDKNPYYSSKAAYAKMPVGESYPSIDYRIVGLYDHYESYKDYNKDGSRFYIAPSVRYNISDRSSFTVYAEIAEDESFQDYGSPLDRNGNFVAPRDFIINHPQDTVIRSERTFGYDFEYEINDAWTFENRAVYQYSHYGYSDLALPSVFNDVTRSVTRVPAQQYGSADFYGMQFNLKGDFHIGNMRNRLYAGFDINREESDVNTTFDFFIPLPLSVDAPVYENPAVLNSFTPFNFPAVSIRRKSFYLQDHLNITDKLIVSGGVRFDRAEQQAGGVTNVYNETNPQAGLVYRVTDSVSAFGNYSESFNLQTAFDINGNILPPEYAQGHEFGVKYLSPDNRFSATAAYFDITRQNVATPDLTNPFTSVAAGEQNSEGFELELFGEIAPGLSVQASYAHIDAVYTADNTFPVGNHLFNVPEHTASFWGKYDFTCDKLDGFGVGFGVRYVGERPGGDFNTVYLDSYTVLSAGLFYEKENWEASVLVDNLADERAVHSVFGVENTGTGSARGNFELVPTSVIAKITRKF